jgi:hypothetical protein
MPRLRNCEPYGANPAVAWFSGLYRCSLEQGRKHFEAAAKLSRRSAMADPTRWPAFLLFDRETGEWHGSDEP